MKKMLMAAVIVCTVLGASAAFAQVKYDEGSNDVLHL